MRKIDIFMKGGEASFLWHYVASTIQAKTCKEAKANFLKANPSISQKCIKANFRKA